MGDGGGDDSRSGSYFFYRDVLPFAAMVMIECMVVGGNTLFKSATSQGINSYVFTAYVFLVGSFFLFPLPFVVHRGTSIPPMKVSIGVKISLLSLIMYLSQICGYTGLKYSSPTLSSIMSNLSPAFTFALAFLFRMEKINLGSYSSQAKIVGTILSIAGALIATLYNGQSLLSNSASLNWIIGGILLASQNLLLSFSLVAQAQIMAVYPVDLMVIFVFGVSGLIISVMGGLLITRDLDAWKLKPNEVLAAILYMGISSGFLNVVVQIWALRLKGPFYVAMFKPLTILIAVAMGVIFLGDSLNLGSVVGGMIISIGFYAVLWGKAKEDKCVDTIAHSIDQSSSSCTLTAPLLQHHFLEEGASIS